MTFKWPWLLISRSDRITTILYSFCIGNDWFSKSFENFNTRWLEILKYHNHYLEYVPAVVQRTIVSSGTASTDTQWKGLSDKRASHTDFPLNMMKPFQPTGKTWAFRNYDDFAACFLRREQSVRIMTSRSLVGVIICFCSAQSYEFEVRNEMRDIDIDTVDLETFFECEVMLLMRLFFTSPLYVTKFS